MKKKLLLVIICLIPFFAKSESLFLSLNCITASDFNHNKYTHGMMMVDMKSTDDGFGYVENKFISNKGKLSRGMTYFKASDEKDGFILFSTRQNSDDIGKDADFLGININNQGDNKTPIYAVVIERGHDSISKHHVQYYCFSKE